MLRSFKTVLRIESIRSLVRFPRFGLCASAKLTSIRRQNCSVRIGRRKLRSFCATLVSKLRRRRSNDVRMMVPLFLVGPSGTCRVTAYRNYVRHQLRSKSTALFLATPATWLCHFVGHNGGGVRIEISQQIWNDLATCV